MGYASHAERLLEAVVKIVTSSAAGMKTNDQELVSDMCPKPPPDPGPRAHGWRVGLAPFSRRQKLLCPLGGAVGYSMYPR